MLENKLLSASQVMGTTTQTYVEDVFSTYLYTGNGTTQTINNGIDLASKGGMVWTKQRSSSSWHSLIDTVRGNDRALYTNGTAGNSSSFSDMITNFNANGYSIGADSSFGVLNTNAVNVASLTFRKAQKFFDIVTYTGNGTTQTITHNLGSNPGMIIIKRTDSTSNWVVYHRSNTADYVQFLNTTGARVITSGTYFGNGTSSIEPGISSFTIGTNANINANGGLYIAYIYASDVGGFGISGTDNIITCGSYTGTGATYGPQVNLGYEPQFVMIKASTTTGSWAMFDNMRGITVSGPDKRLYADTAAAEVTTTGNGIEINATGFRANENLSYINAVGQTYIFITIRRGPMKIPTDGNSVYNSIARIGNGVSGTQITGVGFPPDLIINKSRAAVGNYWLFADKLRGTPNASGNGLLYTNTNGFEGAGGGIFITSIDQDGETITSTSGINANGEAELHSFFRRAPGFFDEVCYTGTGVDNTTIAHNLKVIPELMIIKSRSINNSWLVLTNFTASNYLYAFIDSLSAGATQSYGAGSRMYSIPTVNNFYLTNYALTNQSNATYVAYLFASCPNVSKVFSYAGNGGSQFINCGFVGGARFVLIKRTDSTGEWYVYDTARGMTVMNDPYLRFGNAGAEIATLGSCITTTGGFTVNAAVLAAINTSGATYIGLAIA